MDPKKRLMMLWHILRDPRAKPPVSQELDQRLDAVDTRERKLSADSARRARQIVRQGR